MSAAPNPAPVTPEDRTLAPFGRRLTTVSARDTYGPYVVLRCLDGEGPRPRPGQFYMLASAERWGGGEGERPYLPRAFSVLRVTGEPGAWELHFLIEDVGPGTRRLGELHPGEGLVVLGPLGRGFTGPGEDRRALLVGGGVGIAPLAIWQDELELPATVLLGFRDGGRARAAALLQNARVCADDGSVGHHGPVTDLLADELSRDPQAQVYACGPPGMLEAVRQRCAERRVPSQLALESGMACGFGACFGCAVATRTGYVRLCLDGPVLDGELLESALIPGAGH